MTAATATGPVFDPAAFDRLADEPAFGLGGRRDVRLTPRWSPGRAAEFLAHAIVRDPGNLAAHVQRIALAAGARDGVLAYGALLDLFVALGARGADLRARMLRASERLLAPAERTYLEGRLEAGVAATDPHPPTAASMLSRGITGTLDAVARAAEGAGAPRDPLLDARDYVNEGNLAAARATLEAALDANPARPDLAGELLDLYRHTHNVSALRAMKARLGARLHAPAAWETIERSLHG
jgi:hypothetical protein